MTTDVMKMPSMAPGADLDAYLRTISRFPILSSEQEKSLAQRLQDHGDLNAARELVMCHLRFVVHLARSYKGYGLSQADLIQEGNVGLMKAVKRFDPSVGVRLISFAVHWIKAEMHEYILRNWRIVKVATTKAQRKLFFNLRRLKTKLEEQSSSLPYDNMSKEIAKQLEVPVRDVDYMSGRLEKSDQSLNAIAFDESGVELQDLLADERTNPEVILSGSTDAKIRADIIARAMAELSPREYTIIKRRRLSDEKVTLESLGHEFGVSKERVRQLEARALGSIKDAISSLVESPSDLY